MTRGRALAAGWLLWSALLVVSTMVLVWARNDIEQSHAALTLLLIVLGGSVAGGRGLGFTLACVSFALIDYYFQPPFDLISVNKPLDVVVLVAFLATAGAATDLLARARLEAESARERAREVQNLSRLGATTLRYARTEDALGALAAMVRETLSAQSCDILPWHLEQPFAAAHAPAAGDDGGALSDVERRAMDAAADGPTTMITPGGALISRDEAYFAGDAPETLDVRFLALPLRSDDGTIGILLVRGAPVLSLDAARRRFLAALTYYAAIAIEHRRLVSEAAHLEALRETSRAKDQVLASVSHDLRTPLTTITMIAQEIEQRGDGSATAIVEQANRLARIVGDLLELSKLRVGALSVTPEFNTAEDVIGAALRQSRGIVGTRRIVADVDIESSELTGMFDFVQTLRILGNLLDNALRHSPPQGVVDLRVRREGAELLFVVADRGPGIAATERERVFEAFYRPADATPDAGRAGMGLSIARSLAELQSGRLDYAEREGGGSELTLRLPAVDVDAATSAEIA